MGGCGEELQGYVAGLPCNDVLFTFPSSSHYLSKWYIISSLLICKPRLETLISALDENFLHIHNTTHRALFSETSIYFDKSVI